MQNNSQRIVILGTGGTIAGQAARPEDTLGYRAGAIGVQALVQAVPALAGQALETEQVAQCDSKDMDFATWQALAQRCAHHLARAEVGGVVVTHGTDTLEETAWFLHRVLAPAKPLVLTAAMRPASALGADGPQNLADAVTLALQPSGRGVMAVLAGAVHGAADLRKQHSLRQDAFASVDGGPIGRIDDGRLRRWRDWPDGRALGLEAIQGDPAAWPWVAVLANHVAADGREVRALVAAGVHGLVVAGTGNGSLAEPLARALHEAVQAGVAVRRCTRCPAGGVLDPLEADPASLPSAGERSAWQARIDLVLDLLLDRLLVRRAPSAAAQPAGVDSR